MNAHSPQAAEQAGLSAPQLARIGDFIQSRYIDDGRLVGAQALVARRGQVAYQVSLGEMDRERGRPMAEDAIFRIYSMTKPVTSLAMMMLFERGLFQLNDPITSVLPEFSSQRVWTAGEGEDMQTEALARPVTFRDLLRHTAGLTYGGGLQRLGIPGDLHPVERAYQTAKVSQPDKDLDSFIVRIGKTPLRYQPGEAWMYSLATDVCGAVVQRLSGKRLDVFFQQDIFGPLGMVDTGFHVPAAKADRLTACYQYQRGQPPKLQDDPANSPFLKPPVFLSGGGGLVSTLKDYHRFCEMLRGGGTLDGVRLIGPRTLGLMHANHLPGGKTLSDLALDGFSESGNAGVGFGLGFAMTVDQMATANLGEDDYYWGGVASTIFWVDPWEDLVVILLTQLIPSSTYPLRAQLKNVAYSAILD
jgi:CubicO group peptidase (beta-lactamase class C family)